MRTPSGCASRSTTTASGFRPGRRRRGRLPHGRPSWAVPCAWAGWIGRADTSRSSSRRRDAMSTPLRLIVADDHTLFRQGLRSMLTNLQPEVSVVAEVERVSEVAPALDQTPCDILLLDLQMERNALADIEGLARRVPVVVVTASQQSAEALAAIRAGARAVVFKRF